MSFPEFILPPGTSYPQVTPSAKSAFPEAIPTNSWFQNGIVENIIGSARYINSTPLYVKLQYTEDDPTGLYFIGITDEALAPITDDITDGNLSRVVDWSPIVYIATNEPPYTLESYTDFCVTLSTPLTKTYIQRGSPYITIVGKRTYSILPQVSGEATFNSKQLSSGLWFTEVQCKDAKQAFTSFITRQSRSPRSIQGSIQGGAFVNNPENNSYTLEQRPSTTSPNVVFEYYFESGPNSIRVLLELVGNIINTTLVSLSGDIVPMDAGVVDGVLNYNFETMGSRVLVQIISRDFLQVITRTTTDTTISFFVVSDSEVTSLEVDTSILQVGMSASSELLERGAGSYVKSLSFIPEEDILEGEVEGTPLMYFPLGWKYFQQGYPANITSLNYTIPNVVYEKLQLTTLSSSGTFRVIFDTNYVPPEFLPSNVVLKIPSFLSYLKNDAVWINQKLPLQGSSPYAVGTICQAGAQVLLFADSLGIDVSTTEPFSLLFTNINNLMIQWLSGANYWTPGSSTPPKPGWPAPREIFLLKTEPVWKGVITQCDFLNYWDPENYPLGSFGNSFYNDHHFQWGYFYFVLTTLRILNKPQSAPLFSTYVTRIEQLLRDTCNPSTDNVAYKARHKDFYAGHSWATGFPPNLSPSDPGAPKSGPIERNEESAGEAINCYWSAYHLASFLDLTPIAKTAKSLLFSEYNASIAYNWFDGLQNNSILGRSAAASLIGNRYKKVDVQYGSNPADHNGRMNSIYDILALPVTNATPLVMNSLLANNMLSPSRIDPYTKKYAYGEVVSTDPKADSIYQIMVNRIYDGSKSLAVNEVAAPLVTNKVTFFQLNNPDAMLMLKLLSFSSKSRISGLDAEDMLKSAYNFQIANPTIPGAKDMDSFSNTYYWLWTLGLMTVLARPNVTALVVRNGVVEESATCSIPLPTPEELLGASEFGNAGLVEIPIIHGKVCLNNARTDIIRYNFQVIDNRSYTGCVPYNEYEQGGCTELKRAVPIKCVVITQLTTTVNIDPFIDAPSIYTTFSEKVAHLGEGTITRSKFLGYTSLRLILSRLLFGSFDPSLLTRRYEKKFFERLLRSRFCKFYQAFVEAGILDYGKYFKA